MNFAVPSAILLAALALPIVAFYILKVRMRRIPVSTNLFWKQIFDERPPRSLWQHFRHLLSLLAQLFILGSLVFAFADPYFSWQILQARRLVLVVDPSASMKSTDVAPTRFAAAIRAGQSIVEGLRFRDELAIVVAGPTPEVAVGMTGHIPTLRRALLQLQPTDNPTSLTDAIQLARQLVGDHKHRQVVVLTDGCASSLREDDSIKAVALEGSRSAEAVLVTKKEDSLESESQSEIDVQYRLFASSAANIGIHQFQVRRSLIDPIGYEILVGVFNASDSSMRCRLELELEEAVVDVIPLELKANEKWSRAIEKTSLEGGRLAAKLTKIQSNEASNAVEGKFSSKKDSTTVDSEANDPKGNGLAIDDQAWAILPARKVQDVLIVTPGNPFLTKVFQANPLVNVTTVKEIPIEWPADTLIVLHQIHPEVLPASNVLVIDPWSQCDLWEQAGVVENPIITEIDKSSPLMHHIRLDNVLMPETKQLRFLVPVRSLAGTLDKTPVFAEVSRGTGKCLVLSVDLEKSDLAFRTVFPMMVANALGWFSGNVGELMESQSTGSAARVALKESLAKLPEETVLFLRSPASDERLIPKPTELGDEQNVQIGPFDQSGIWEVIARTDLKKSSSNKGVTATESIILAPIAVNLANANETDLRPKESMLRDNAPAILASGWFSKPIWYYLVGLATALLTFEWFLYQRRIIT